MTRYFDYLGNGICWQFAIGGTVAIILIIAGGMHG